MEIGKLPMAIVGITIAVIVCAVVLIPVVSESTQVNDTYSNETNSMFKVEKITTDSPYLFVWDIANRTVATINGEQIPLTASTLICTTNDYLLRYTYNTGTGNASIQSVGGSLGIILSTSNATTGSITVDNTTNDGYLTFTVVKDGGSPTVKTYEIGDTYGISNKGDYVMKSSSQVAYLKGDSDIVAMGLTTFNGEYATGFYVSGTPDDGFTAVNFYPVPATVNVSDLTSDLATVYDHLDLYTLKEIKFKMTSVADPTITANATYSFFIVPNEVVAERSVHPDATTSQLINVIPILVIIGIVMLAVGTMIYYRR